MELPRKIDQLVFAIDNEAGWRSFEAYDQWLLENGWAPARPARWFLAGETS